MSPVRRFFSSLLINKNYVPALLKQAGFTMIELLVVIAVIGVLAVAVLSSINPIEQINKGRDTRTRSDAAQLINAVDRYYAIHEAYPWNVDNAPAYDSPLGLQDQPEAEFAFTGAADNWGWIQLLVSTGEVKEGFTNRLETDDNIVVFKEGVVNATMYACFLPTSLAFKQEAMDNCNNGTTADGIGGIVTCVTPAPNAVLTEDNLICLP